MYNASSNTTGPTPLNDMYVAPSDPANRLTYNTPFNTDIKPGTSNPGVMDSIRLINSVYTQKNARDTKNQQLNTYFEQGFELHEPNGPRKITSKKLLQAFWNIFSKIKPQDFAFHGLQAEEWEEQIVTEGMSTVLKKGSYDSSFRDKGGMMVSTLMYGDGFRMMGTKGSKGFPIEFLPVTNSNVYVNNRANAIRNVNKPASRAAIIFSGSWDDACRLFPEAAKKAGPGKIPRDIANIKETDQTWLQRYRDDNTTTEWCYYYDIDHAYYCLFMGSACTVLDEKQGKKYPFTYTDYDNELIPYIPISHYYCIPSMEGFYNHGIGDMIFDLIQLYNGIFNQMAQSVEDNVYSLNFVSIPNGTSANFNKKMEFGYQQRALGLRPFVPIEYGPGNANPVNVSSSAVPTLINEAQELFNRIDLELKRIGIYLDDPEVSQTQQNKTATEILYNIERANEFVQQIMECNTSETEFELKVAMEFVKRFIKDDDMTPLDITTTVKVPDPVTGEVSEVRPDMITLGMLKKTLKERHWFVKVNSRTGVIPSSTMRRAQIENMIQFVQPGSAQSNAILKNLAKLDDLNIDFDAAQQQQMQQEAAQNGQGSPMGPQSVQKFAAGANPPEQVAMGNIPFRSLAKT